MTLPGPQEGTAVVLSARAGDRARLMDGRGNVKEWQVPFDGEHATRFAASPDAMFYRLEVRRTLTPGVELLVALSNPVFIEPAPAR
ncbi:MAG: hypothetical protein A2177_00770 [Spirochaetes bacterium RBG_13_68_11]|nr:MAG: hypothetical protein A2177_00770 [Spirochaetes bacterium RBG_13_68_11]